MTLQAIISFNFSLILISCCLHIGHSAVLIVIITTLCVEARSFKSITEPSISFTKSGKPAINELEKLEVVKDNIVKIRIETFK